MLPAFPSAQTRRQVAESRRRHGLPFDEADLVHEVAARQVERLELDEARQAQELAEELKLAQIEARTAHFEALAAERDRMISAEIGLLIRRRMMDEDAAVIALILAAAESS